MRRWWAGAAAVALTAGLVVGAPVAAHATTFPDSCNQVSDARKDLKEVTFEYSASSFLVSTTGCGPGQGPNGPWSVTLHLTSFTPEVQVTGAFQDLGKYVRWSGYFVCATGSCEKKYPTQGFYDPAGTRVDGPCIEGDIAVCPGITVKGHGSWADVLPSGTVIPDAITWYAEVKVYDPATQDVTRLVDRAPESGVTSSARNTTTYPTTVTAYRGPTPTYAPPAAQRTDGGQLRIAAGGPVIGRMVRVRPYKYQGQASETNDNGVWSSSYWLTRNTTVRACFSGDGEHDPSCSEPYLAGVKAFVSLDLAASTTVRRGSTLLLKGVVRPRASGQVQILVREDKPGTSYRLLRYGPLAQGSSDSYYRIAWSPTVRGRYVLRARWNNGTSAEGGVMSNVSDFRIVTVS